MAQVTKASGELIHEESDLQQSGDDLLSWTTIYGVISSKNVRRIVVGIGAFATFLPWFLSDTFQFNGLSQNLFFGLMAANSLGLEFGALLFYVGLLMLLFESNVWSIAGGSVMALAVMTSTGSIQGYSGWRGGAYHGVMVVLYALLPVLDFFIS